MSGGLKLENIIFTGRTYDEYVRMFNLSKDVLHANTLFVCPGGASSFTALATKNGYRVRAGDILYGLSKDELHHFGQCSIDTTREKMGDVLDGYNWGEFGDMERLLQARSKSLSDFLKDYPMGSAEGRYIHCTLPKTPLADDGVDVVLSDHLLFTYPQFFDYEFHLRSIEEMIRVAKSEVRLFPLVSSSSGTKPPFFRDLMRHLLDLGLNTAIETVKYHFQIGGNEMLKIQK